jgi:hypothetical protein
MEKLEIVGGTHISDAAVMLCAEAIRRKQPVYCLFNSTTLIATTETTPQDVVAEYDKSRKRGPEWCVNDVWEDTRP